MSETNWHLLPLATCPNCDRNTFEFIRRYNNLFRDVTYYVYRCELCNTTQDFESPLPAAMPHLTPKKEIT